MKWGCEFYPSLKTKCKKCCLAANLIWQRSKRENDPEYVAAQAAYQRIRKYGLTPDDFDRMLKEQDGKCVICKTFTSGPLAISTLQVDHDHNTKKVRGLLCMLCNTIIGKAKEDPEILLSAVMYLIKHGGQ